MIQKKTLYSILLIVIVGMVLMFGFSGMYPLMDPDEPVYAETAREMIAFDDFVSPRIYGEFWYDKPLMYYWLVAGAFQLMGNSEFAARFPSGFLAIAGAVLLYMAGRKLLGERASLLSSLILLSSLEYFYLGNAAVTDVTLTFFLTASLLAFLHRSYYLMYICCGLAVLTKGPVGLFFCGIIIGLHLLLSGSLKQILSMKLVRGVLLFSAVALPWYLAMYSLHGMAFVETFLGFHNVTRFLEPEHTSGVIWYYYIPVLVVGFFPWTAFLVQSLWRAVKEKGEAKSTCRFLFLWAMIVFVFFSISQTKLVSYILPMYPPLAMLGGCYLDRIWAEENRGAFLRMAVGFAILAVVLIGGLVYAGMMFEGMDRAVKALVMILLAMAIGMIWLSVRRRWQPVFAVQLTGAILFFSVLMAMAMPVLVDKFSVASFVPMVEEAYDGESTLYVEKFYRPGFAYYGDMAGKEFLKNNLPTILNEEKDKAYFVMKNKWYDQLNDADKSKLRVLTQLEDKLFLVMEKQ